MKRLASYLLAPLVCLAVWWRVPFLFFRDDDYSWLTLPRLPLLDALFSPFAQGTIRVFSERLYFLGLTSLFGLTAWPFRAAALGLWFIDLALIQWIGTHLTGSRAAGALAAILWTASATLSSPLGWASAFNQVLIAFVVLAAFAARLKGWHKLEAVLYLAGFGVLEIIVMYPILVLVHAATDPNARARWRSALWMLIPAALFTALHLYVIPKTDSEIYRRVFDARLPATLHRYLLWTVDPRPLSLPGSPYSETDLAIAWITLAAVLAFAIKRLAKSDLRPLFFLAWFLIWLAPVLPLPNHMSDYYLTVPGIGLAWLAAWGLTSAWRSTWLLRIPATALAVVYLAGSYVAADTITTWQLNFTSHGRIVVRGIEATAAAFPGQPILLTRIDPEVFLHSVGGGADRTLNVRVWLAPDQDELLDSGRVPELDRFRASGLPDALQNNQVRVLDVEGNFARDITARYRAARAVAGFTSWSSASRGK